MSQKVTNSYKNGFNIGNYNLTELDKKVFNIFTKCPELNKTELASKLNLTRKTVSQSTNKPEFKKAYNDFQNEDTRTWIQILIDARGKASKKLVELIDCDNHSVSIRAAENILQLDKLDLSDDKPEEEPY